MGNCQLPRNVLKKGLRNPSLTSQPVLARRPTEDNLFGEKQPTRGQFQQQRIFQNFALAGIL